MIFSAQGGRGMLYFYLFENFGYAILSYMKNNLPIILILTIAVLTGIYFFAGKALPENLMEMKNSQMLEKKEGGMEVVSQEVEYFAGVKGYFARPANTGHYKAGVVMIHEWWGLNDNIKDMARELAKEGYLVLAVDLYNGKVATTREDAQKYRTELKPEEAVANMRSAVAYLRAQGAERMASLGWCFGGGKSLELALSGEKLDATIIYYGQLVLEKEKLQSIKWPVLGIFGGKDASISAQSISDFGSALTSLGIKNSLHTYPEVGHAFANPSGANFAPEETKDAWAKTLVFLTENLRGIKKSGQPVYSDDAP